MDKEELINIVNYRIETSYGAIKESESHLSLGFLSTAMNRIYYAGFYIVSALAVLDNFSTAKHKQLIGYFNKEYISSGKITPEDGKILRTAYDRRQAADYHDFVTLTKTQIDEYRLRMAEFIRQVDLIIQQKLKDF
ncbi:MAG: HEPN domain-containing protein [Ignavibacteria bacterium]